MALLSGRLLNKYTIGEQWPQPHCQDSDVLLLALPAVVCGWAFGVFDRGTEMQISIKKRGEVYSKTNGHCGYCGVPVEPFGEWQIDHMIPSKQGGNNDVNNLIASCRTCNQKKKAKDPEQFRAWILERIEVRAAWIQHHLIDTRQMIDDESYHTLLSAATSLIDIITKTHVSFFYEDMSEKR